MHKNKSKKYIRPEFKYSIVSKSIDKIHPTQKPIELIEELIKIHTNKNDWIFDPFMGSGTTCIASLNLKRNFIGCEIDKYYFQKVKDRIERKENIKKEIIRSPLYYLGDKYKLFSQLYNFFPANINNFYDVFAGGGTVIANVNAKKIFYNDINKKLVDIIKIFAEENVFKILNDIYIYIWKT